ncbi:ABC transporter permease [Pseudomonas sp. F1_0610]|uniref:ABC transporter permease n=1 Tax=Pseudomonas sp. F1_0610 TaxID=3114284 RepID=UPI0039C1C19D
MEWGIIYNSLPKLWEGAQLTLELVALSVVLGLLVAIPVGIARSSAKWYIRAVPSTYVFLIRGTPLLLQLFFVYYVLAQLPVVRESFLWPYLRKPYWCALLALTLHTAAYISEIIRGSIKTIPRGEIEAAQALGLSRWQTMFYIILPRAARIGLPAYGNEVILMLKASALACTVTLMELMGAAKYLASRNYMALEMYFAAGIFYLVLSFALIMGFRVIERGLRVREINGH